MELSTALYRALFDDLAFDVVDHVAEGDRVASRFVLTGSTVDRRVRPWGITISRLRDGQIVEGYSAFDSLALLTQPRTVANRCWPRPRCYAHCATLALVDGRLAGTLAAA